MTLFETDFSIWNDDEAVIRVDTPNLTESDIVHQFLKDLDSRHFTVRKIAFFEEPFHAVASLGRRDSSRGQAKTNRKKVAVTTYDAELRIYARKVSDEKFGLRCEVQAA